MKENIINRISGEVFLKFLLIIILALIIYSNSFNASWHLDDYSSILDNYRIKSLSTSLKNILFNPRGVCDLTFAVNYYFFKKEVFWYHFTNLTIHVVSALMVYLLIRITLVKLEIIRSDKKSFLFDNLPLAGALVFVAHPLQTQAVTYIVQRYTSLAAMFYLIALLLFIKARMNLINENAKFFSKSHFSFYLCSFLFSLLAMRTKEIGVTIPVALYLYNSFFLKNKTQEEKNNLLYLLPFFILILIPVISRIYAVTPDFTGTGEDFGRSFKDTVRISRTEYALTSINVVLTYIRLLLFPVNQNIYHDYPLSSSLFANYTYLSLLVHISILTFAFIMYRRSKLITFGILWFYITLSVESSIVPIRDVIFEHRVYLPSAGFVLFLAGLVALKARWKNILYIFFAIIIFMLSIATFNRNSVWKNEFTLWNDCLAKSKNNVRAYLYLGNFYQDAGLFDLSIAKYMKALSIDSSCAPAHNNLGLSYEKKGFLDIAASEYIKAINIIPDYAEAHNNLGNMFYKQGKLDLAIKEYLIALKSNPYFFLARNNLGNVYLSQGRTEDAIKEFKTAIKLSPDNAESYYNLGRVYYNQKKYEEALKEYQTALKINPGFTLARKAIASMVK